MHFIKDESGSPEAQPAALDPKAHVGYQFKRLVIRSLRIACGLCLALAGIVLFGSTPNVSETPFASLTLGAIFGAGVGLAGAILLMYWAWLAAFGAGPKT